MPDSEEKIRTLMPQPSLEPDTDEELADAEEQPDDAVASRILMVLVVMFVFMFVVGLITLYFVARR